MGVLPPGAYLAGGEQAGVGGEKRVVPRQGQEVILLIGLVRGELFEGVPTHWVELLEGLAQVGLGASHLVSAVFALARKSAIL